jgi:hypothetical protein
MEAIPDLPPLLQRPRHEGAASRKLYELKDSIDNDALYNVFTFTMCFL